MTTITAEIVKRLHLASQWARVKERLQAEVGEVNYHTWLRDMALTDLEGDEVVLTLPTRFLRDWVSTRYGDRLRVIWQFENASVRRVDIRVGGAEAKSMLPNESGLARKGTSPTNIMSGKTSLQDTIAEATANDVETITKRHPTVPVRPMLTSTAAGRHDDRTERRSDIAAPLDPRFTFEGFVVGKPNEFAYACARRVAERPSSSGFNPLFLYGGVGLGKTHLMHAIAWELRSHASKPVAVAYLSAEKFMYQFIGAIRSQSTMAFKESLRSVDVLMIDDLQFLIGKDNTQDEFFHTFNYLVEQNKQIVVSADTSPSDLNGLENRLRTRLGCGMVADLLPTTYELRISILEAKAARAGVNVPVQVLEFLAHKITSNVRELEGALNRLVAHANLFGRPVTLEATHEVLHDLFKSHDRRITIEAIQKKVAEHFHIRSTDMSSARRARAVARPRQVAMYLAKQLTSRSLPEIGRKFGNRDHTTVMHAVSRVTELMKHDSLFAEDVDLLKRLLEA